MSHLYFNKESGYSDENKCENEVFDSTILHHRKKLNIFMSKLPIYCIQYYHRKSRLMQMPETANGSALEKKKAFFKISQNSEENNRPQVVDNFIKKETLAQVFCCEFYKIFNNTFFTEQLRTTAPEMRTFQKRGERNILSLL